jgi:hypothetical protein
MVTTDPPEVGALGAGTPVTAGASNVNHDKEVPTTPPTVATGLMFLQLAGGTTPHTTDVAVDQEVEAQATADTATVTEASAKLKFRPVSVMVETPEGTTLPAAGTDESTGPSKVKRRPAVPTTAETVSTAGYDAGVRSTTTPCRQATELLLSHETDSQTELPTRPEGVTSKAPKLSPESVRDAAVHVGTFGR